jgi:hypothetical protein
MQQATEQKAINPNNMPGMTQPSATENAPATDAQEAPAPEATPAE